MAAFRFKKSQKTYTVKAFSSLVQLAKRGMIDGDDPIFVPQIDRWVPAKAIKELRPHLTLSPSQPEPSKDASLAPEESWLENMTTPITFDPPGPLEPSENPQGVPWDKADEGGEGDDDSLGEDGALELPIAYVEAVSEEEVQARREKYKAGMRALAGSRKERSSSKSAESKNKRPDAASPSSHDAPLGLVGLPMAQVGGTPGSTDPESSASLRPRQAIPKLDLSFEPPRAGGFGAGGQYSPERAFSSGEGITVEEVPQGIRFGRIGALLALPLFALGIYYWQVNVVASQSFPDAPPPRVVTAKGPGGGSAPVALAAPTKDDQAELELRAKVPLKLRRPVVAIEEVQDDIFAELLNGGAYPKRVRIEPLAGELPPHAALRKVEVIARVAFGSTEGMEPEEQLALGALVIGKYIRAGELRVAEVQLVMEDAVGGAIASHTLSAAQSRDFYSRQVRLDEFLEWLEAGSL